MEVLVGRIPLEGFGTFMVRCGKGASALYQHWIFLDNRSFTSDRVPAFRFQSCPSPLVPWRGLWFWVLSEIKIFSSVHVPAA